MKLEEERVLRDPIHGYIHIDEEVIWKLIDTPEFQRLRRIHQLGGVMMVYHSAEHSRFAHSLGVYEICRRILNEVPGMTSELSGLEQKAGLCAALLHDLGHGPFSHTYEAVSRVSHEEISRRLITHPDSKVFQILYAEDERLPKLVSSILAHESNRVLLEDLISSQLDCDRMDYLLRDSYETGTSYGRFDLERILRTLRVRKGRLCIKKSGVHSVEDYIMGRYQMYWQVYLHPDASGYESLIHAFFKRYAIIRKREPIELLEPVFDEEFAPVRFLRLDDGAVMAGISLAQNSDDQILADLASRIISRRLLRWENEASAKTIEAVRSRSIQAGFDPDYYVHQRHIRLEEYLPYSEENSKPILVLDHDELKPLSACSVVARSLLEMKQTSQIRLYWPKEAKI